MKTTITILLIIACIGFVLMALSADTLAAHNTGREQKKFENYKYLFIFGACLCLWIEFLIYS